MEKINGLSWQAIGALAITVAGFLGFVVWAPPAAWDLVDKLPWEAIVAAVVTVGGWAGSVASGSLVKRRDAAGVTIAPVPPAERTSEPPRSGREGFASPESMAWVLLWAMAAGLALAQTLSGCGSVLGTTARTATVALVAVQGVQRAADTGHEADVAACLGALPCLDAADARWIPVAEAADAIGVAIVALIGTLETAALADGGGTIDEAIALAFSRAFALWPAFVEVCRSVGLELPALALPGSGT